jgi:hypothetical protein
VADAAREVGMRRGVVAIDSAAQDCDGLSAGLERSPMRLTVDPASHPADDHQPRRCQLAPERACNVRAVRGAGTGPDDRDRRACKHVDLRLAANEQAGGRVEDRRERARVAVVRPAEPAQARGREARPEAGLVEAPREPGEAWIARGEHVAAGLGGVGGNGELAHVTSSSLGER